MAAIGGLAVVTQVMVAYAASLAKPGERGPVGLRLGHLFRRHLAALRVTAPSRSGHLYVAALFQHIAAPMIDASGSSVNGGV
jgi:hypothetical protein